MPTEKARDGSRRSRAFVKVSGRVGRVSKFATTAVVAVKYLEEDVPAQ
jgi:hypothetical protein